MKLTTTLSALILAFCIAPSIQALTIPSVPTEPIYFEPPVVEATDDIRLKSCVQLDNDIRYLHPYSYTYKDKFTEDKYNAAAVASVTLDYSLNGILSVAYIGYSALVEDKEQRRMLQVEQQIAMLQQVKAEKHCFE